MNAKLIRVPSSVFGSESSSRGSRHAHRYRRIDLRATLRMTKRGEGKSQRERLGPVLDSSFGYAQDDETGRGEASAGVLRASAGWIRGLRAG